MSAPALALEDAVRLLSAVARQWCDEARRDPQELLSLAAWLDMPADDLRRRLALETQCRWCGGPLPAPSKRKTRLYCSRACAWKAGNLRRAKAPI